MSIKKILLTALIINIAISLIPIPRKEAVGNICQGGWCYEYHSTWGFPIPFLEINAVNSPIGSINTEIWNDSYVIGFAIMLIIFLINGSIIASILALLNFIYIKIRKLASPNNE